jgi:Spy/CpxP family protein refolding chaperone
MRSIRVRLLVAGLAVLLGAAIARSQSTEAAPPPGPPMHGPGAMMGEHMLDHFTKALNLTEDQQTQAKTMLSNARPALKTLMQQQRQIDEQLRNQAQGSYDAKQVQTLAAQKAQVQEQLTIAETQLHHQFFQLLTPDQQAQLKQIEANHEARWHERMQQETSPAPPAQ